MSRGWEYRSGDWWITCDVCSKQIYASESRKRWDGFIVCKEDWEPRHAQDFLKARLDKISVPFSRPEPADVFITINYTVPLSCTPLTSSGEADRGTSDCARADIRTLNDLVT